MTPSDDHLLDRLRQKDPEALAAFLEINKPRLLGYIERSLGAALRRKLEPADIVQEVCVQALRILPWDRGPGARECQTRARFRPPRQRRRGPGHS